jgi:hypothetical protein
MEKFCRRENAKTHTKSSFFSSKDKNIAKEKLRKDKIFQNSLAA